MNSEATSLFHKLEETRIFPLQTVGSMAERWGMTKQLVNDQRKRRADFPKPIVGMVTDHLTYSFYPLYEVERYELARGLTRAK